MKKILSIVLALTMVLLCSVNAAALGLILPIKGDADANGFITAADARLILRASVGLYSPPVFRKSIFDADSDGKISAGDARIVLRVSVGLQEIGKKEETIQEKAERLAGLVSESELNRLMTELCGIGSRSVLFPDNNKKAAEFIVGELEKMGFSPKYQEFSYNGIKTQNVTLILNKSEKHEKILLLSTHYDCYDGSEGAIDNASGVAALLHTLKIIKENDIKFNKEIRIAFFSAEEMGYHGAYHYLSKLSGTEKNRLSVFNIDMAGASKLGGGTLLTVCTDSAYGKNAKPNEISDAVDRAKELLGNIGEEKYYSPVAAGLHDLIPFRNAGIPAATLSWREIRPEGSHGSDYGLASPSQIHTSSDTLKNFNMTSLYNTTRLITATLILTYT